MEGLREIEVQGSVQYIVVKFGDEQFGIDIKYIDNIVRMQRITRVPKVQNFIKGVINLRGEVIPVVSLRIKMELEEDEITLQTSQIEKMAYDSKEDAKTNFISGVGKDKGELISLLDMNLVFAEKEKAN